jgi:hypothetical protein
MDGGGNRLFRAWCWGAVAGVAVCESPSLNGPSPRGGRPRCSALGTPFADELSAAREAGVVRGFGGVVRLRPGHARDVVFGHTGDAVFILR